MRFSGATALAVGVLLVGASPAAAGWGGGNDTSAELRRAVDVNGIKRHEAAFSLIGVATGGNRLAGTRGHDLSADYVALQSRLAGLNVTRHDVRLRPVRARRLEAAGARCPGWQALHPGDRGLDPGRRLRLDGQLALGRRDRPAVGRRPDDPVAGAEHLGLRLPARGLRRHAAGAIVLLQRGTCGELSKMLNAQAAGAAGIVYINEGDPGSTPRRPGSPRWFVMTGAGVTVPIVAAQIATVQDLVGGTLTGLVGKTVRLRVEYRVGSIPTENVIAETRGGDPNKVVVVGAHLDSVGTGPGINDNGSGSAALVEFARELRGVYPKNKIRFIWFSAEESGLLGSEALRREPAGDRAGQDRGDAQLRHDRLAELRQLRLRRRPLGLAADPGGRLRARGSAVLGRRSRRSSSTTSRRSGSRTCRRTSTAARTTARSSPRASRPAASSPGPKAQDPGAGRDLRRHRG